MAFPSSPTNGQIAIRFGRKYQYDSTAGTWGPIQAVAASTLNSVATDIIPDAAGEIDIGSADKPIRNLYLDDASTINIGGTEVTSSSFLNFNLTVLPEVLEIQVDAPAAGHGQDWLWTWETSSLPYARIDITNSAQVSVPLYKQGTYTINNFANELHGDMTQTHQIKLKWIEGAGDDNLIDWVTYADATASHPDINGGNSTSVKRLTVNVPENIVLPTLVAPTVSYNVGAVSGAFTFTGTNMGNNIELGPMYEGGTYTFILDGTVAGHPFYLTTDNGTNFVSESYFGEYTTGVTGSRNDSGTVVFTVPVGAPRTLYYQCGVHGAMRGVITTKPLAVDVNNNGNYVVYAQHSQEGHMTPVEIRPVPTLTSQMCLVYDAVTDTFVPQDLATYVERTPAFKNKIQEVAGTATLVAPDGTSFVPTVSIVDDATYLPYSGNTDGDITYATDTEILYIWSNNAWKSTKTTDVNQLNDADEILSSGSGITTYTSVSELPLSGVDMGSQAFVSDNNRLYLWNGSGWYNIALINTSPSITGGVNANYKLDITGTPTTITIAANDPEGLPITWSYQVTSGSLTNGGGTTATVTQNGNEFTITGSDNKAYAGEFEITFTASDGVNISTATSQFSLTFAIGDPYYTSTSMLINATPTSFTTATDNKTDFVEASSGRTLNTIVGTPVMSSVSPYYNGTGSINSLYFDGSGSDYLLVPANSAYDMHTNDWTMEMWIWAEDLASTKGVVATWQIGGQFILELSTSGGFNLTLRDVYSVSNSAPGSIVPGRWYHIAWVRSNDTDLKLFVDGVATVTGSLTAGTDIPYYNNSLKDLRLGVGGDGGNPFKGYIADYRFVIGSAVYTTDFTPPEEPLDTITGTVAHLVAGPNIFVDKSSTNALVKQFGKLRSVPFSPYPYQPYDPAVHGGSAFFDTVSYLKLLDADFALAQNDWSFSCWAMQFAWPGGNSNETAFFTQYDAGAQPGAQAFAFWTLRTGYTAQLAQESAYQNDGGNQEAYNANIGSDKFYYSSNNGDDYDIPTWQKWHHVAVSRSGSVYKLYWNGRKVNEIDRGTTVNLSTGVVEQLIGENWGGYIADPIITIGDRGPYTGDSYTVPTSLVPVTANTKLSYRFTGASIIDYKCTQTPYLRGNVVASDAQTKFSDRSIYFPGGTGDYIDLVRYQFGNQPSTKPDLNFHDHAYMFTSVSDLTVEWWMYPTTSDATYRGIFSFGSTEEAGSAKFEFSSSGWKANLGSSSQVSYAPGNLFPANQWYHVALQRKNGTLQVYINGTLSAQSGSHANAITQPNANAEVVKIGGVGWSTSTHFAGYLEDFRVTKTARYDGNFTAPTKAFDK